MLQGYHVKTNIPEEYTARLRVVGGAAAVTKVRGDGLTVAYVSTGLYTITFTESFGTHQHNFYSLNADTPADLAGHTVVFDVFNTSALTLQFSLYNASFALHDLAASEWLDISVVFARTGVVS